MSNSTLHNKERLLLEMLVQHNEKAFRKLYDAYKDDVYAYSNSMIKDRVHAEGIVQDVFMKVWENRASLDPTLSFKAYVFRLTRNMTINLLKKAVREEKLKDMIFYRTKNLYSPSADLLVKESEYTAMREEIIEKLPPRRKLIFEMSRNQGLSHQEISLRLGISESTVKNQMSKALQTIRVFLGNHTDLTFAISALSLVLTRTGDMYCFPFY